MLFFGPSETFDSVKFFVALIGLQHVWVGSELWYCCMYLTFQFNLQLEMHETIRNPAMNPWHVISKMFDRNTIDKIKQFVNLEHFMYPSLDSAAHWKRILHPADATDHGVRPIAA